MGKLDDMFFDFWQSDEYKNEAEPQCLRELRERALEKIKRSVVQGRIDDLENAVLDICVEYQCIGFKDGFREAMAIWKEC